MALRKTKAFGLLVDDVMDISVMQQLTGFAQYVSDDGAAMVKFLFVNNVLEDSSSANAETITKCISNNLAKCELDTLKMMSLVSDGAKVMTGERTGVVSRHFVLWSVRSKLRSDPFTKYSDGLTPKPKLGVFNKNFRIHM